MASSPISSVQFSSSLPVYHQLPEFTQTHVHWIGDAVVLFSSCLNLSQHQGHSMVNRWGNNGNSDRLYFLGLQNHCRWWLQPWNQKCLLLGWKAMTNLDSILKSRDISLLTKVHLVKTMVFPVVMYGCESWTIKKAEHQRVDGFELWC